MAAKISTKKYRFCGFRVQRYRSLLDVNLKMDPDFPVTICGENNVGKTNFLRALNVFFNHIWDDDLFEAKRDMPQHIFHGARGGGAKTELTGEFFDIKNNKPISLKVTFKEGHEEEYLIDKNKVTWEQADEILGQFRFVYVRSNNVNVPEIINEILEDDVLLPLDKQRSRQSVPLKILKEFISKSEKATAGIEKKINKYFDELTDFDGTLQSRKIKIQFAEFERLRDAVKNMTQVTIDDGNSLPIESKGSGAQRAVLLSMMQFISGNSKRSVIWGIDEPEAFLQPKLQKRTFEVIQKLVSREKQPIVITTHSQHFIDLEKLENTHLFTSKITPKTYQRRAGIKFNEIDTKPMKASSVAAKALAIREHLGVENNDGWKVLPKNIIVEGEEDQKYIQTLMEMMGLNPPNINWTGGASKLVGYLQFYNEFARDLKYKPHFTCILDEDDAGRTVSKKINAKNYNYIEVKVIKLTHPFVVNPGKIEWEIEDFLPQDAVFDAVNKIIRKSGYASIRKPVREAKNNVANKPTQILKYAEEACKQVNPDKEPLVLDDQGRKKQICQVFCQLYRADPKKYKLNKKQKEFLKGLQ